MFRGRGQLPANPSNRLGGRGGRGKVGGAAFRLVGTGPLFAVEQKEQPTHNPLHKNSSCCKLCKACSVCAVRVRTKRKRHKQRPSPGDSVRELLVKFLDNRRIGGESGCRQPKNNAKQLNFGIY